MKPRYAARVDKTQPPIVRALRERGAEVLVLDLLEGQSGEPDLLVGWLGRLHLLEIKSAKGAVSEKQEKRHAAWARVGIRVHVVRTEAEALAAVGMTGPAAAARREDMSSLARALDRARSSTVGQARLAPAVRRYGG